MIAAGGRAWNGRHRRRADQRYQCQLVSVPVLGVSVLARWADDKGGVSPEPSGFLSGAGDARGFSLAIPCSVARCPNGLFNGLI